MISPDYMTREELEEEVRAHRAALTLGSLSEGVLHLRRLYDMQPAVGALTLALYAAEGRPVTSERLGLAMPDVCREVGCDIRRLVKVQIAKARAALGADSIETCPYACYRLTDEGMRAVGFALARKAA